MNPHALMALNLAITSFPSNRKQRRVAERGVFLPQECWELIFNRVGNLEPISLVCKEFFSISSSVRHNLELHKNLTVGELCGLLKRLRNLKFIGLCKFQGDFDLAVLEIARSGLNLEALDVSYHQPISPESLRELGSYMKNLKTLECRNVRSFQDCELAAIATSLPWLEELDISYSTEYDEYDDPTQMSDVSHLNYITDAGIEVLASKLKALRRINISGNKLSDPSILTLSSNCPFLTEILASNCRCITQNCIALLFRRCPNLVSLSVDFLDMDSFEVPPSYSSFTIENSIAYAKSLSALEINWTYISDSILSSIAKAHIPLKELGLMGCQRFSFSGLSLLLHAYQSLEELDLQVGFLTDKHISDLSPYLHHLTYINLSDCLDLTGSTFSILTRNCPSLESIVMEDTGLGSEDDSGMDFGKNQRIKYLHLEYNNHLTDGVLKKIGLSCPSLRFLNVNNCDQLTYEGIEEIFKICNKISWVWSFTRFGRFQIASSTGQGLRTIEGMKQVVED